MKLTRTAALLLLSAAMVATPTVASAKKEEPAKAETATKQPKVSPGAFKDLQALDKAVKAKDKAAVATALVAAKASAKTADDKYVVNQLALTAAIDSQDRPAILEALQGTLDSGFLAPADQLKFHLNISKLQYEAKNFEAASASLQKALQLEPQNVDALAALSDTHNQLKRYPDALATLRKAIALKTAAGAKPDESWYRRAAALAYNNKLPGFEDVAIDWLKAYPTKETWAETLHIYQRGRLMDPVTAIDVSRLLYAVGAMKAENDFYRLASAANSKGFPGEAKAVLEAGFASGVISKSNPDIAPLYNSAVTKSQGDRASLAAQAKTAAASPDAKRAIVIGDAYYGYGDYAEAIALYRAALAKPGVDKDLANLHLGMALARSGDKAGAEVALKAVGGTQAQTAKFWLAYLTAAV